MTPLKQKFITLATSEGLDRAFEYFPNADIRAKCSVGHSGLKQDIRCIVARSDKRNGSSAELSVNSLRLRQGPLSEARVRSKMLGNETADLFKGLVGLGYLKRLPYMQSKWPNL